MGVREWREWREWRDEQRRARAAVQAAAEATRIVEARYAAEPKYDVIVIPCCDDPEHDGLRIDLVEMTSPTHGRVLATEYAMSDERVRDAVRAFWRIVGLASKWGLRMLLRP